MISDVVSSPSLTLVVFFVLSSKASFYSKLIFRLQLSGIPFALLYNAQRDQSVSRILYTSGGINAENLHSYYQFHPEKSNLCFHINRVNVQIHNSKKVIDSSAVKYIFFSLTIIGCSLITKQIFTNSFSYS